MQRVWMNGQNLKGFSPFNVVPEVPRRPVQKFSHVPNLFEGLHTPSHSAPPHTS